VFSWILVEIKLIHRKCKILRYMCTLNQLEWLISGCLIYRNRQLIKITIAVHFNWLAVRMLCCKKSNIIFIF